MGTPPELRSPEGEGAIDGGDRQARAAFGLVVRDPTLRLLVALEVLALGGLGLAYLVLRRQAGSIDRDAERIFENWLFWVIGVGISTIGSFAVTCAMDAKIDGVGGGLRMVFGEVRQRLSSLLAWWLCSAAGLAALIIGTRAAMRPLPAFLVVGFIWGLGSFFVIPAIVLGGGGPLRVLGETARLLRAGWGRALVGLLEIGFMLGLLYLVFVIAARAPTDGRLRSDDGSFFGYVLLLAWYLFYASAVATRDGFALILARDALDDLPGEPPAAKPRRKSTVIFRRATFGVLTLVVGLIVLAAIFGGHPHR